MMKLLVQTKDRTFRICGPELTGQGFMRRDIILLGGGCFFLVDLGKGAIPQVYFDQELAFC
jgi:hypothetical protein